MVEIAQNLFSTRRGSILVGGVAALLAGIVLFVYLHNYRNSVNSAATPVSVLVAKNLIPKGTPGDIIGSTDQFQVASLPKGQLQLGALTDPASLTGRIAVADIYPGQQLTATAFAFVGPDALQSKITAEERVINITTDNEHGLIGDVGAGDRVDVFVGLNVKRNGLVTPIIKLMMAHVLVLRAPVAGGSGILTLRAPEALAGQLAYAADNGKLWFVLRPASGAKSVYPPIVTADTLLGTKPVPVH